jgi:hypothetical protein
VYWFCVQVDKNTKSPQSSPVALATAVPWNGVEAQPASSSKIVVSAVASPIAVSSNLTVAQPEQISYEVVSCRPVQQGMQPRTGPANLLASGADIDETLKYENHRKAKDAIAREEANLRKNSNLTPAELRELEEIRRGDLIARGKIQAEERNIDIGNRTTIASSAQGEKTVLHVQVPFDAKPGMLLSLNMPSAKKGDQTKLITFPVPQGAVPGGVIEIVVGVQDTDEAAVLAKMERLRLEAEERVRREAEQEEYSYKGLGDGEYEYRPEETPRQEEEEYTYGG